MMKAHTREKPGGSSVKLVSALALLLGVAGVILFAPESSVDARTALPFLLAVVLLNSLDVWLPHGDAIDVDSAMIVAAAFVVGVPVALGVALLGRLLAHLLRYQLSLGGQLLVVGSRRAVSLAVAMPVLALSGPMDVALSAYWSDYLSVLAAASVYVLTSLLITQLGRVIEGERTLRQAFVGNLRFQGSLLISQVSLSVLTIMLHGDMGVWGILLTLTILLIMRQSFAMLLEVRQAYRVTLEAFADAVQVQLPDGTKTADTVARCATDMGSRLGLYGDTLERLGYAALLHSVDGPPEEGSPRAWEYLREVHFLEAVLPVLDVLEGRKSTCDASRETLLLAAVLGYAVPDKTGSLSESHQRILGSLDANTHRRLEAAAASSGVR